MGGLCRQPTATIHSSDSEIIRHIRPVETGPGKFKFCSVWGNNSVLRYGTKPAGGLKAPLGNLVSADGSKGTVFYPQDFNFGTI